MIVRILAIPYLILFVVVVVFAVRHASSRPFTVPLAIVMAIAPFVVPLMFLIAKNH
jgi:hypothetical protein